MPIHRHDEQYAGESVPQKLNRTTNEMRRLGVTTTIISALDEVAWQFNLRGSDIPFNPFFKAYAIIHTHYRTNPPELFLHLDQLRQSDHLNHVRLLNYSSFGSRLNETVQDVTAKIATVDEFARPTDQSTKKCCRTERHARVSVA
jgi:hypothetical protein